MMIYEVLNDINDLGFGQTEDSYQPGLTSLCCAIICFCLILCLMYTVNS